MKQKPSWNPKSELEIQRGVAALRGEPVDLGGATTATSKMLAERAGRPTAFPVYRLAAIGAAGLLAGIAFWPHPSGAASLAAIKASVHRQTSRYERVFKPDSAGNMVMYFEQWGAPGKYANRFGDEFEYRFNGHTEYSYRASDHAQVLDEGEGQEIDPVGLDAFAEFQLSKVETEGANTRYEFHMSPSRQDLLVDSRTQLPLERDVYNPDGSIMEIHKYTFDPHLSAQLFEPDVKPNIPCYNVPAERRRLADVVSEKPQVQMVDGIRVELRAVIVDAGGNVGALVTGGDPRPPSRNLQAHPPVIPGLSGGYCSTAPGTIALGDLHPSGNFTNSLSLMARVEKLTLPAGTEIPDQFTLRVPIWKVDPHASVIAPLTGDELTSYSRFVGYAEFQVHDPLRTLQIERILPHTDPPTTASTRIQRSK